MQKRRLNHGSFLANEDGAVAAMYAIALTGLIIVAGAAFDYSRVASLDTELQNAADQAALAGVTQLDQTDGSCARAGNAAIELLRNVTLLGNDDGGNLATIRGGSTITVTDDACASFTNTDGDQVIQFFSDTSGTVATTDETARYIMVAVDERVARYAFTPLGELYGSDVRSLAVAGIGSAICELPPLMICDPGSSGTLTPGIGIQVTGHGGGNTAWAPGDFGFLEIGSGQLSELVKAIAYANPQLNCTSVDADVPPETGNAQDLYRAINTRFDIYDFPEGEGTDLGACFANGTCPSATNVVKDVLKSSGTATSGNACKLQNNNFELPPADERFWPKPISEITNPGTQDINQKHHQNAVDGSNPLHDDYPSGLATEPTIMGYGRDLCHYDTFNSACTGNRFGDGRWPRSDYFAQNHGTAPTGSGSWTRYQTYLWELGEFGSGGSLPDLDPDQRNATPICSAAFGGGETAERRVLTVAIVTNCGSLSGTSTNVDIGSWWRMFLVEPTDVNRGNGSATDEIYMEAIGPVNLGSGAGGPLIRRDVPYLLE